MEVERMVPDHTDITEPEVKQRPMYQATAKTARNHMSDKETNFTFEVGEE
jgi:hypothetical protein